MSRNIEPIGSVTASRFLAEDGRCCGRKPIVYKRPRLYHFCDRCCRKYDADGNQESSWAYTKRPDGRFIRNDPLGSR